MRLDTGQHRFYAGIDLHASSLYAHVLDECRVLRINLVWPFRAARLQPRPTPQA